MNEEAPAAAIPPESSVVLAAKHRLSRMGGPSWDDQTHEERELLMNATRDQICAGPLLTKAKALARMGATSWDYPLKESAK